MKDLLNLISSSSKGSTSSNSVYTENIYEPIKETNLVVNPKYKEGSKLKNEKDKFIKEVIERPQNKKERSATRRKMRSTVEKTIEVFFENMKENNDFLSTIEGKNFIKVFLFSYSENWINNDFQVSSFTRSKEEYKLKVYAQFLNIMKEQSLLIEKEEEEEKKKEVKK